MSKRILHMVCTALLVLAPHLLTQGCSSAQQEDGDLQGEQASNEGNEAAAEGNVAEENSNAGGDEAMDNGSNVAEEGGEENFNDGEQMADATESTEGGDNQVLAGNQTQNDLESIIAGQNADQATTGDAAVATNVAEGAPTESTETAPMAAPAATAGVSAGPALPEQGSKMPYIVRVGDSLSSIAKLIYGSNDRWTEMAELSAIKNPNLVRPGDVVYYQLTQETMAFATAYESSPRNEVTVQRGDTLAGIAQRIYGTQGDWKYVWRQNAMIENPDRLEVGQSIVYLSPATLGAALEYAKSISIADLMGKKVNNNVQKTENVKAPTQTIDQQASNTNSNSVNGFELAKDMFNVFTANFATAG